MDLRPSEDEVEEVEETMVGATTLERPGRGAVDGNGAARTARTRAPRGRSGAQKAVLGLKVILWLGALAPGLWLLAGAFLGWLGVNPIEKLTHVTGMTALVLLLVTLAVTPVRWLTGWNPVIKLRRPLGLFAFFYAFVHFSIWMGLDLGLQFSWIWEDIKERPYITVGFTGFVLLIPLAVTSTKGWIRRLGRNWTRLHRLTYVVAALGVVHYYWLVKADTRLPLLLGGVLALLLAFRLWRWRVQAR